MLKLRLQSQLANCRLNIDTTCEGPVTAIYGASGAGKTTLLNLVAGLRRPDIGQLELDGDVLYSSELGIDVPPEARRLGVVFQEDLLFPHLSVDDNLRFGYERLAAVDQRFQPEQIIELLEIGHLLGRRTQHLSGGERQRIAIGRALLSSPRMLLMDEPLSSLDQGLKSRIIPYLRHIRSDLGIPILYVSHSVAEILELTWQVLILRKGEILAQGDFSHVAQDPQVLPLLDEFGFENVVPVQLVSNSGDACIAQCGEQTIRIPSCDQALGSRFFVGVRADDIILALRAPEGLSVRNALRGTVTDVATVGPTCLVTVDVGHPIVAKVTPEAVAELDLKPGMEAWCLMKTHSLRLGPEIE